MILNEIAKDQELYVAIKEKKASKEQIQKLIVTVYSAEKNRSKNIPVLEDILNEWALEIVEDVDKQRSEAETMVYPPCSLQRLQTDVFIEFERHREDIFSKKILPSSINHAVVQNVLDTVLKKYHDRGKKLNVLSMSQVKYMGIKWMVKCFFPSISDKGLLFVEGNFYGSIVRFYELAKIEYNITSISEELQDIYVQNFYKKKLMPKKHKFLFNTNKSETRRNMKKTAQNWQKRRDEKQGVEGNNKFSVSRKRTEQQMYTAKKNRNDRETIVTESQNSE
ncbi:uncharacterized protein [Chelonus insularis]|nr:uncharacterized protein LOC118074914 isoform X2 [Chelonus insularis]